MRFRILSAAVLMAASASASAAQPIGLISSITLPTLPGIGTLVIPLPALVAPNLPLLGSGGLPALDNLLGGNGHPALPQLTLPGLLPLPAVPIPVTDILASFNAIPILVSSMQAFAPLALAIPIPVVSPIFANF